MSNLGVIVKLWTTACVLLCAALRIRAEDVTAIDRMYPGSEIASKIAVTSAQAVVEGIILDQGAFMLGGPGQAYRIGMKVKVVECLSGFREGEVRIDMLFTTWPTNAAEVVPKNGDRVILFLGGDKRPSNQVMKIILPTQNLRNELKEWLISGREGGTVTSNVDLHPQNTVRPIP